MTRYELSISTEYVSHWGVWEGVRELLQNAIDQDNGKNTFRLHYSDGTLTITNPDASLKKESLLLGVSSKLGQGKIGQWGEGYKLAFLCLLRSGISIRVRTGSEIWTPKTIQSRRYGGRRLLVVDVSRTSPAPDLSFEITGIRPEQYADIVKKYLGFCEVGETIETDIGRVLLDTKWRGKIFVAGLYVCDMPDKIKYGYDMHPGAIQLDRDRNKVGSFNLYWETSRMYATMKHRDRAEIIHELIGNEYAEIEHYTAHVDKRSALYKDVCELDYREFLQKHGSNAVAVLSHEDKQIIMEKFNNLVPVIVPNKAYELISCAPSMASTGRTRLVEKVGQINTPYRIIKRVIRKHQQQFSKQAVKIIETEILERARDWSITTSNREYL